MIFNLSYHKKEINQALEERVGKSFSFVERFKMKGVGSQRFIVTEADAETASYINQDTKLNFSNIELREKGILVWFRVKLHVYALVLPYYMVSVYKSDNSLRLYGGKWFVNLVPAYHSKMDNKFIRKLLLKKSEIIADPV